MTIRALLLKTDDTYETIQIDPDDEQGLQALVGGSLESLPLDDGCVVALVNEEGKQLTLPLNWRATKLVQACRVFPDIIVGPMVVVGMDGGEIVDAPHWVSDAAGEIGRF